MWGTRQNIADESTMFQYPYRLHGQSNSRQLPLLQKFLACSLEIPYVILKK
jgi:hypothetical protein